MKTKLKLLVNSFLFLTFSMALIIVLSNTNSHQLKSNIFIKQFIPSTESAVDDMKMVSALQPVCRLPKVDPFSKVAMEFYSVKKVLPVCTMKRYGRLKNGFLVINESKLQDVIYQRITKASDNDGRGILGDPQVLMKHDEKTALAQGEVGCILFSTDREVLLQTIGDPYEAPGVEIRTGQCHQHHFFTITSDGYLQHKGSKRYVAAKKIVEARNENPLELIHTCEGGDTRCLVFDSTTKKMRQKSTSICLNSFEKGAPLFVNCSMTYQALIKPKLQDITVSIPLNWEYIRLAIFVDNRRYLRFLSQVAKKSFEKVRRNNDLPNIALVMFDATSNANFQRQFKKSYKWLTERKNQQILHGHSVAGDATPPQLTAMFTGHHIEDMKEGRAGFGRSEMLDHWPFIFKDFENLGYVTLWDEDDHLFAPFNFRLKGFANDPAHFYTRPFKKEAVADNQITCLDSKTSSKFVLDYLMEFHEVYKDIPKFSFTSSALHTHGDFNGGQYLDEDFHNFLVDFEKVGHLDNTILIVFGDHGYRVESFRQKPQGYLEERLPFMSVSLPSRFVDRFPNALSTLQYNSQYLTSHFDIHATLRNLPLYPQFMGNFSIGQSLFQRINITTRTCQEAGIPDHFCPCRNYQNTSVDDAFIREAKQHAIKHINQLLAADDLSKSLCAKLSLKSVQRAGVLLDDKMPKEALINLQVSPSNGLYEVTIVSTEDRINKYDVKGISRINKYGDEPKCIATKMPHLREFCYCKS